MASVLVVDDDADVRDALSEALGAEGHQVLASDEGRKALELAAALRPELVILDLHMPGVNGWQFLERRRTDPAIRRVPVVIVTGDEDADVPADAVLRKPFDLARVAAVVRTLLRRGRRQA